MIILEANSIKQINKVKDFFRKEEEENKMTCAFPLDTNWASQAICSFSFLMLVSGFLIKKTFIHVCELEANE